MNILILGDKYTRGMKSKGCQALLSYNQKYNYFEYQYNILTNKFASANIVYVYGLGDKKFVSYIQNNKLLDRDNLHIIHNQEYEIKNDIYSIYLCKTKIDTSDDTLIIFGNSILNRFKFDHRSTSCLFTSRYHDDRIGCVYQNGFVENIGFDLDNRIDKIYYIARQDMGLFMSLISDQKNHNKFIFEIINLMIDKDTKVQLI